MSRVEVHHDLADVDRRSIGRLLEAVEQHTGQRPLSDQLWLDFVHGDRPAAFSVMAEGDHGALGYCQVSPSHGSWTLEMVVDPAVAPEDRPTLEHQLLASALDEVAASGGGRVRWWVAGSDEARSELVHALGMHPERTLHEMRVPLPLPSPHDTAPVATRPFRPGVDDAAWLAVNNAAFHWHPEQGGWDATSLTQRMREPWFDPAGFLLHERDGRIAAFCWTKIHDDIVPPVGEIYVIAVSPDFHGLGLGRALTVAGLASLAHRGVTTALLYVDADNEPAVGLYHRLGFTLHSSNRAFVVDVAPAAHTPAAPAIGSGGSR